MKWIDTTVGEYCPFIYGKSLPQRERENGEVPVYGSNGIVDYHNTSYVKNCGIIIGRKGSVGAVHLSKAEFWPIDTAFYIEKDSIEELYFTYFLLKSLGLEHMNSDSAVPGLNRDNAHALTIRIPESEDDRKSLGSWLSQFDKKLEINNQTNQTLEQIAQALFKSWFVDFDPVKAKIETLEAGGTVEDAELAAMAVIAAKTPVQLAELKQTKPTDYEKLAETAALFPAAMQESELGEIPVGWSSVQVGDLVLRLKSNKRYTTNQVAPYGTTPVYEQGASILLGFHSEEAGFNATPENPIFIFGDHTCITHLSCSKFDISANVIPLKGSLRPTIWTYYAIKGKQKFQEYRRHWSEFIIKDVVLPPLGLTESYTELVSTKYLLIESLKRQSKQIEQLRDTLLPKLLSYEIGLRREVVE